MRGCPLHGGKALFRYDLNSLDSDPDDNKLGQKDGGHAILKVPVSGLVMIDPHADNGADAASQGGKNKEGLLRDAPYALPRPPFVYAKHQKCQDRNGGKVNENDADQHCAYIGTILQRTT